MFVTLFVYHCHISYSHLGRGDITEKMSPSDWPMGKSVQHVLAL